MVKSQAKGKLRVKRFIWLTLLHCSPSSKQARIEKHDRNLEARAEAEEARRLLAEINHLENQIERDIKLSSTSFPGKLDTKTLCET